MTEEGAAPSRRRVGEGSKGYASHADTANIKSVRYDDDVDDRGRCIHCSSAAAPFQGWRRQWTCRFAAVSADPAGVRGGSGVRPLRAYAGLGGSALFAEFYFFGGRGGGGPGGHFSAAA